MHKLYELKETLCAELEEYGDKEEITASSLDIIDKLAHSVKNIDKIIKMDDDDEYSNRGRRGMYSRRDRYSRRSGNKMVEQLEDLMDETTDERTKQEIQRLISKINGM